MIAVKIHLKDRDTILAACDEELVGKTIGTLCVSSRFYDGERVSDAAFAKMLDKCTIANLLGQKVINIAKKKGLIDDKRVIMLSGIPHAQFVRML